MADKIKADALAGAAKGLKHAETKEKNPLPTKAYVLSLRDVVNKLVC